VPVISQRAPYVPRFARPRSLGATLARNFSPSPAACRARARVIVGADLAPASTGPSPSSDTLRLGGYVLVPALGAALIGGFFGGLLVAILASAAGGGAGYALYRHTYGPSGGASRKDNAHGAVLRGKIFPCGTTGSPGLVPLRAGVQSDPMFRWCYRLGPNDTAGSIAAAIVGDEARFQELVAANFQHVQTQGLPGRVGPDEWNFAAGEMREGLVLALPAVWALHIDPLGNPAGRREPFPEDPRLLIPAPETTGEPGVKVEGYDVTNFLPSSPDGEFVQYGAGA
jgi:hypothetical protein